MLIQSQKVTSSLNTAPWCEHTCPSVDTAMLIAYVYITLTIDQASLDSMAQMYYSTLRKWPQFWFAIVATWMLFWWTLNSFLLALQLAVVLCSNWHWNILSQNENGFRLRLVTEKNGFMILTSQKPSGRVHCCQVQLQHYGVQAMLLHKILSLRVHNASHHYPL